MLERFPLEILLIIAEWLCPQSIRSLCLVSSRLFAAYRTIVYHTLAIRAESEWALNILDVEKFFGAHGGAGSCMIARFNRCAYFNAFRNCAGHEQRGILGCSNEAKAHEQFVDDISRQVQLILSRLESDQLHSFRWRLGVCLPQGVVDERGLLPKQRNSLRSLALVTDASCPHAGASLRGLGQLTALEELAWEGVQHPTEVDALRACLRQNRHHLRTLVIGSGTRRNGIDLMSDVLGIADQCISDDATIDAQSLGALSRLSLSRITLPPLLDPPAASILTSLEELILRDCPNELDFLDGLALSTTSMRIQRFELSIAETPGRGEHEREIRPLMSFLLSFRGLIQLNLRLSRLRNMQQIHSAIAHHRSSLKGLVYHECLAPSVIAADPDGAQGYGPTWLPLVPHVVDLSRISHLALSASPSLMLAYLQPHASTSAVRVLHFRFSAYDHFGIDPREGIVSRLRARRASAARGSVPQTHPDRSIISRLNQNSTTDGADAQIPGAQENGMVETSPCCPIDDVEGILDFAEWAFGPTGLRALEFLGVGDFSHEGRYEQQHVLFVRPRAGQDGRGQFEDKPCFTDGDTFAVAAASAELWPGLGAVDFEFLSSCPSDSLMDSPFG
ncbi:hypothetical protein N7468_009834 [Penicillium chermesinum]|uniref:F-box domain-containing protein n=1 Tax=Penicillium chermesinum TaxID=63820 RepID=A0A9W9NBJ9_9EURO|nr:uncharacterized protein N7468_009834 [Penicillium chermesinum]KAJ5216826.1 hypothetical protein N7468_009834 [Penicillium chermesinum]